MTGAQDAPRPSRRAPRSRPLAPALHATIAVHAAAPAACLAACLAAPNLLPWIGAALLANHGVLTAAGMWPRSTLLGPNMRRLRPEAAARAELALTFDDGPDPAVTPHVLDMLDRAGARASFFCIGTAARAHPTLLRQIVSRGHRVENHSFTHPNWFACLGPAGLRRQIGDAQAALADITGTAPAFFRAPMGLRNPLLDPVLAETSLRFTSWTRRAMDGLRGDPGRAYRRLTRGLAAGDILLMHDGRSARSPSGAPVVLEILPRLLLALQHAGLKAVSLPPGCAGPGASVLQGAALSADAVPAPSPSAQHACE